MYYIDSICNIIMNIILIIFLKYFATLKIKDNLVIKQFRILTYDL